jgi:hypothetical protein
MLALLAGCGQLNNPYKDSGSAIEPEMTTASADGFMRHEAGLNRPHQRTWSASTVAYENGAVTHWPLWFEDPFEDYGNRLKSPADRSDPDNEFAWNGLDYLGMVACPGREFVNLVGWPISAAVSPPGLLMESDGRISRGLLGYQHDAERSSAAHREPPDVVGLSREPVAAPGAASEPEAAAP